MILGLVKQISSRLIIPFIFLLNNTNIIYAQKLDTKGRLIVVATNENNEKLVGATVIVGNSKQLTKITDINGEVEFDLLPGLYDISTSYAGYDVKIVSSVIIIKSEVNRQQIILSFKSSAEVVITGRKKPAMESISAVYAIQKNNNAISDVISIEQIKKTPDVNVNESLKRMNGVTIVENKFVVVRGMGERYNNVLLNGSQLPSTEANKKNFSFDILPNNIIDNIVVNKTATPDLPADFSGGLIQITTKQVPDKNSFSISVGGGVNTQSIGKEFLSTKIERSEYAANVEGSRQWYLKSWQPDKYFVLPDKEKDLMNGTIPNNWSFYRYLGKPMQTYQFSGSLRKKFPNNSSLGFLLAGSYRNQQNIEQDDRKTPFGDSLAGRQYTFTTDIGLISSLSYSLGSHKLNFGVVYSRKLKHENYYFEGVDQNRLEIQNYASYLNYVDLIQYRLEGESALNKSKIRIKWSGDIARVNRDLPDGRLIRYLGDGVGNSYRYEYAGIFPSLGGTSASQLDEKRKNAGINLFIPVKLLNAEQSIRVGYLYNDRDVAYLYTFLRPVTDGTTVVLSLDEFEKKFFGKPVDQTIMPEVFRDGYLNYRPISVSGGGAVGGNSSTGADYYVGKQITQSAYAMLDFSLVKSFRVIGGVRMEDFTMKTNVVLERDLVTGDPKKDTVSNLKQKKLFPSLNLVYKLTSAMNLRLAYSQTVSRPEFRDIAPVGYFDFSLPGTVNGNPNLKNTSISNFDARFEFFPKSDEIVSGTFFYKLYKDPIEILAAIQSNNYDYQPFNLTSSTNIGFEVDFRKSFSFLGSSQFLRRLYLNGNFSYMDSKVEVDPSVFTGSSQSTTRKRPLIGLSPYSINGGLLYDGEKVGFNVLYNRFGRRLVFVGDPEIQDIYEAPRHILDAQVFAKFLKKKLEVKVNVSDMLNNPFIWYANFNNIGISNPTRKGYDKGKDFMIKKVVRGASFSISANYQL